MHIQYNLIPFANKELNDTQYVLVQLQLIAMLRVENKKIKKCFKIELYFIL